MSQSIEHPEFFERLLLDNAARLRRIAHSYATKEEVDDLLQEIHLQLWRSRQSFTGQAHVNTWLYRVALNTAISHRRRQRKPATDLDTVPDLAAPAGTSESLHVLVEFLQSLNEVNRSVLLMVLDGLSHGEIAEVLGTRTNAVAVRVSRLKAAFESRYVEDAA